MQPTSPQGTKPTPPPLPPRAARGTHSNAGTLVTHNHRSQPEVNAELGILDTFVTGLSNIFRNFFPEPLPSPILILSRDVFHHIFTVITNDKDLCSFILTCKTLSNMPLCPPTKLRIVNFKSETVMTELIKAVDARSLTDSESAAAGIRRISHRNVVQHEIDHRAAEKVKSLEKKLFEIFKMSHQYVNPTSIEFYSAFHSFFEKLEKKAKSLSRNETMPIKLKTVWNNFMNNIYDHILLTYANQPISMITPGSFKAMVNELRRLLPMKGILWIETALRNAIRHPDNINNITALAEAYLNPAPNDPKIEELKLPLRVELESCRTMTQVKIDQLCGNNFNGTIHDAFRAITAAEAELGGAHAALQHACNGLPQFAPLNCAPVEALIHFDMANSHAPPVVKEAHAKLVAKSTAFINAKAQHNELDAELRSLAVWTGGNITGGAIFEIETKLANLDATVQMKAYKLGLFYTELNISLLHDQNEVFLVQEYARSAALHRIID